MHTTRGMSTLEIMIALALMVTAIVGAVDAAYSSQYWALTSVTSNEGLYKAKTGLETIRALARGDFESASTTAVAPSTNPSDPADQSCLNGGLCYFTQTLVTNYSTCAKFAESRVSWNVGARYPTTTTSLYTNLTKNDEIIALGGDCLLNEPEGSWDTATPSLVGSVSLGGEMTNGIDALQRRIYVVSSSTTASPKQLRVYNMPTTPGNPTLLGTTPGTGMRLNALDAQRDLSTGRTYVYAAQHATSTQLAVFDVTDASAPALLTTRGLSGVDGAGSFPEGWRVFAYGLRLYITTRETAGPELHIFNINSPAQPTEIVGAKTELTRTVNSMVVRDEMYNSSVHRYLFLASKAGNKEIAIVDVTNDIPSEVAVVNLSGGEDMLSIAVNGERLYAGRQSAAGGPELYVFDIKSLLGGNTTPLATAEIGADITSIKVSGGLMFIGTSRSGGSIEVRTTDTALWSTTDQNAGRFSAYAFANLGPLLLDVDGDWIIAASQNMGGTESLSLLKTP